MPESSEKKLKAQLAAMANDMAEVKRDMPPLLWAIYAERCKALNLTATQGAIEALREWIDRHPAPIEALGFAPSPTICMRCNGDDPHCPNCVGSGHE
jgi:hypothetical protein